MTNYDVKGMSCAACQARVEKAVNNVEGVTSCAVSLLTNSMSVEGDVAPEVIMAAVKAAGYKAKVSSGELNFDDDTAYQEQTHSFRGNSYSSHVFFDGCHDVRFSGTLICYPFAHNDPDRGSCALRSDPLVEQDIL